MAFLRVAVALLFAGADALLLPSAAGVATPTVSRSSTACMKHNDYFMRVQRAESGRLRLCVSR